MKKKHLILTLLLTMVFSSLCADKLYDDAMEHYNNGKRYLREAMQGTSGGGSRGALCKKAENELRKAMDLMEKYRDKTGKGDNIMVAINEQLYASMKNATMDGPSSSGSHTPMPSENTSPAKKTGFKSSSGLIWGLIALVVVGGGIAAFVFFTHTKGKKGGGRSSRRQAVADMDDEPRSSRSSRRGRAPASSSRRRAAAASSHKMKMETPAPASERRSAQGGSPRSSRKRAAASSRRRSRRR